MFSFLLFFFTPAHFYQGEVNFWPTVTTTTTFICMTIIIQTPVQTHTVLQKAMFRNQNYNTGQLRYFDNNIICHEHQNKLKCIL